MYIPFRSKLSFLFLGIVIGLSFLTSCDDDTNGIGADIMPDQDKTQTSQAVYSAFSKSIQVDSLIANTTDCFLGKVTDPETGSTTVCSFLAQFYNLANYELPKRDSMMMDDSGNPFADSVYIHLYINSYYGDSLNSMKIAVYELDSANIVEEDASYYTNFDASQYLKTTSDAIYKEKTFSVVDMEISDSIRNSDSYSKYIRIKLPASFGTKIINKYYAHPEYFKNSYQFIHHVMPGFYFKCLSGNGTLVNCDVATVSIYFRYNYNDSTYTGVQRVASTGEVLQNNTIENKGIDKLLANPQYTFLKTPAGIFTEVELPIDSIIKGHENDSINGANIVFQRVNNDQLSKYNLSTASQLLLISKDKLKDFFEERSLPDGENEFVASFNSSYNSYTFDNIATLITAIKHQMETGAGISASDSEATRKSKRDAWVAENPDWNKVVLVPVTTETNTYGYYTKISHEFDLTSTKLAGGADTPIQISVVYSKFKK